jgi:hypothetical protein
VQSRVVALPGEETLIGSWTALTQLSPAAQMINTSATTAAVFPSWAPLNNAILQIAPDDRAAKDAVSQLAACYVAAGWRHGHCGYAAVSRTSTRPTPGPRSAACSATRRLSSCTPPCHPVGNCRTASFGPPSRQRHEPATSRFATQTSNDPTAYPGSPDG